MAVSAGDDRRIGLSARQVINQAYVDKNVRGIAILSGRHHPDLHAQGRGDLRTSVILSKISNAILANNQRRLFAKLMSESVALLLGAAFVRVPGAADRRRQFRHRRFSAC